MKKISLLTIVLPFISTSLFAQDKIYKKHGPVINAKVIEIGPGVSRGFCIKKLNTFVLLSDFMTFGAKPINETLKIFK